MSRVKLKSYSYSSNPTKLKKIHKNNFKISLKKSIENFTYFEIDELELKSLSLPSNSSVYIYVSASGFEIKFDLGSVSNIQHPKDRFLTQLPTVNTYWFRLLVVDDETSKIIASSEGNRAKGLNEKNRESLLPVDLRDDLKNRIWKVHLVPEEQPILYLNNNFPKILNQIQNGKVFQAVILQEAMRISLKHFIGCDRGDNNPDTWKYKWDMFLKELNMGKTTPESDDDPMIIDKWIDKVIEEFSKTANLFDNAVTEHIRLSESYGTF